MSPRSREDNERSAAFALGSQGQAFDGPREVAFPHRAFVVSADKFPPFRVDVGNLIAEELDRNGWSVVLGLQSEDDCNDAWETEWKNCHVYVGPTDNRTSRWGRLKKHALAIRQDLRTLRGIPPGGGVLIVKDKFLISWVASRVARRLGMPFVYWLSYPFPESDLYQVRSGSARYSGFYLLRGLITKAILYRFIGRVANTIIVQSEQMVRDLHEQEIEARKLYAVPMGVSDQLLEHARELLSRCKPKTGRLLYLGTLVKERRLDFLVRVLARVRERFPQAELVFVGGGEDAEDEELLWRAAKRSGVEQAVTITGRLPREQALELTATAAVCFSPFHNSPMLRSTSPTKLVEYMALGKAVIANHHPEHDLVIGASGGGLCVEMTEAAFAEATVSLLQEPDICRALGRRGRRWVAENRSYTKLGSRLSAILNDALRNQEAGTLDNSANGSLAETDASN